MTASWNMSDMPMVGEPVVDNEGQQLGTVKEVQGRFFKVDVSMAPDYWLSREAIGDYASGRVKLAMRTEQVGDHKVDEPDQMDDQAGPDRGRHEAATVAPGSVVVPAPATTRAEHDLPRGETVVTAASQAAGARPVDDGARRREATFGNGSQHDDRRFHATGQTAEPVATTMGGAADRDRMDDYLGTPAPPITDPNYTDQSPGRIEDDVTMATGSMAGGHVDRIDEGLAGGASQTDYGSSTLTDPSRGAPAGTTERREWTTPTTSDLAAHRADDRLVVDRARRADDDPMDESVIGDDDQPGYRPTPR